MRIGRALVACAIALLLSFSGSQSVEAQGSREQHGGVAVMPGGTIVGGRIVYSGGDVVVVPNEGEAFDSCPNGWVCLFEDAAWQGNMLQFNTCCAWNNLSAFGFNNIASSWRNRMSVDAQIAKEPGGGGAILCLNNGSYSSTMPAGWDNAASSIRVRSISSVC